MPESSHIEILKAGVEEWNHWREQDPTIWPNLLGASLSGLQLQKARLENANLLEANLTRASLQQARLRNANLKDAKLARCNLREADLSEANLYNADLREADLSHADLRYANLTRANLDGADLTGAFLGYTSVGQTVLTKVQGLGQVTHETMSSIDIETLEGTMQALSRFPYRKGELQAFFDQAGVPRHLLRHYFDLSYTDKDWYSCFISYSHQDEPFVSHLCSLLDHRDIDYFLDKKKLEPGDSIPDQIGMGIRSRDKMLLACSKSSLASEWVQKEIELALQKEERLRYNVLIPMDLDGYVLSDDYEGRFSSQLRNRLIGKFVGWQEGFEPYQLEFEKLTSALRPH